MRFADVSLGVLRPVEEPLQPLVQDGLLRESRESPTLQSSLERAALRAQAREALVKKAKEAAEKVKRWGDIVELEPLSAFDRRIIHQALKDDPTIETHSVEVEGTEKKAILLRPRFPPVATKKTPPATTTISRPASPMTTPPTVAISASQ